MNERIKQLMEQARLETLGDEYPQDIWEQESVQEKLAELIVRECAQFVEDKFDFIGDEIIVKEKMLEHFGVEE